MPCAIMAMRLKWAAKTLKAPWRYLIALSAVWNCAVAGWPVLGDMFYDTWAYRKDGQKFSNFAPYHPAYVDHVFEVDSAGSVLLVPAEALRQGVRCTTGGLVEVCAGLKARGYPIYVDPHLKIEQPMDLWSSSVHPTY